MKNAKSSLIIDLGGTKIRYLHYVKNKLAKPVTLPSPITPLELLKVLKTLFQNCPSDRIYLAIPGPMPIDKSEKYHTITLPPLKYSINTVDLHNLTPPNTELFILNDMFSYVGLFNESSQTKIGVLAIGTSTGFGIYERKDKIITFNSFEIAHEKASLYMPVRPTYTVKEIISGTALEETNFKDALRRNINHKFSSEFTLFIEIFCRKIAKLHGINELYITGGGLIKAYGTDFQKANDLLLLVKNTETVNLKIKVINSEYNYLLNTGKVADKYIDCIEGSGVLH